MKKMWLKYAGKFDAMSKRERIMVAAAALVVLFFGIEMGMIEPLIAKQKIAQQRIDQQGTDLRTAQAQVSSIQPRLKDPEAANRAALERLKQEVATIDTKLKGMEQTLVPPTQMPALLGDILRQNRNLKLVSLRTLPVSNLVDPVLAKSESKLDPNAGSAIQPQLIQLPAGAESSIFKHGVEISVQGTYPELLAYLAQIERLPQHMFWSKVRLNVDEYPMSTMTITVYTLSLDKAWLVV